MRNYLSSPLIVDFNITRRCNLDCKYCYANAGKEVTEQELSLDEIKNILMQLQQIKVQVIRLSGGEPLMREDFIEIVECCDKLGMLVCMNTNGTLITDRIIECLKRDCIRKVGISLDSYKENLHDEIRGKKFSFEHTMDAIRKIIDNGLQEKLSIVITLSNRNASVCEVEQFLLFLAQNGVKHVAFQYAIAVGRGDNYIDCCPEYEKWKKLVIWLFSKKEEFKEKYMLDYVVNLTNESDCKFELFFPFIESGRRDLLFSVSGAASKRKSKYISCQAGNNTIAIAPDGKVYPCELMMCYHEMQAGDLRMTTFQEIWNNSSILNEIRNMKMEELDGVCISCSMKEICGGGCRAASYAYSKNIRACDIRCKRVRDSLITFAERIKIRGINVIIRKEKEGYYFTHPITLKMYCINKAGYTILKGVLNEFAKEMIVNQLIIDCDMRKEMAEHKYSDFYSFMVKEMIIAD